MSGETPAKQWKQLYAVAMLELDPANVLQRINDAHQAILDRVEELHTRPSDGEQHGLNDALQSVRILRERSETENDSQAKKQIQQRIGNARTCSTN
jgi:hypothetical protein